MRTVQLRVNGQLVARDFDNRPSRFSPLRSKLTGKRRLQRGRAVLVRHC
jgi:hypothetical protein